MTSRYYTGPMADAIEECEAEVTRLERKLQSFEDGDIMGIEEHIREELENAREYLESLQEACPTVSYEQMHGITW